jgi:hypothetical protein
MLLTSLLCDGAMRATAFLLHNLFLTNSQHNNAKSVVSPTL